MRKIILCLLTAFAFGNYAHAQENPISSKFGLGFHLNQYQDDFGLGLNVTSPYFANNSIAIRARGNFMFHQHWDDDFTTTWSPYQNFTLGVIGGSNTIGNFMRLYGEGGVAFLLPSSEFSSESSEIGGYGLFGFEFYMDAHSHYFIELGGIGTGAVADKVRFDPIYSNGFTMSVGYRMNF